MQHPDYVKIIKDAWKITWTNRYLWWFGLLAALSCGGSSMNFQMPSDSSKSENITRFIFENLPWIIPATIALIALVIILAILGLIGRGALIKSIDLALEKNKIGFKEGFNEGKKFFWKLLFIGLIIGFSLVFSIIILSVPIVFLFINKAYALGAFLAVFAVFILIALIILTSFLKTYGYIYAVLGKLSVWPALENAYRLFCDNLWTSVIMGLFLIPVGIILALGIFAGLIPIAIVFLSIGFGLKLAFGKIGVIVAATLGGATFIAFFLLLRSIYETFVQTIWIIFFKQIASPKVKETAKEEEIEKNPEILPTTDTIKTIKNER